MHVEAAQQQVETAMRMAREIDLLQETDERQKTFQVVADANRVVEVHAIVVSAYVLTILAYAINHDQAVTAATEATQAAVALLQSIQPPARASDHRGHTRSDGASPVSTSRDTHSHGQ